jgi:hypothetical protein
MSGVFRAFGPCYACGNNFDYNPDTVPSVFVDPQTRKPPDVDPEPGGFERAYREPICPRCVAKVNPLRAKAGKALLREGPT